MSPSKDDWIDLKVEITKCQDRIGYLEKITGKQEEEIKELRKEITDIEKQKTEKKRYTIAMLLSVFSLVVTIAIEIVNFLSK